MKRKFVYGVALCLAFILTGCGNSKEQQAANYYQKELGLDKEEAEELAREVYGNEEDDTDMSDRQMEEIVIEPLPELVNSEWYEQKIQVYDMVFSNDWYMTEEDIRKAVENSAYDVELNEDFDSNGNVCITNLSVDGKIVNFFTHGYKSEDFEDFVQNGILDDGDYYLVDFNGVRKNCYDRSIVEFENLETRDNVLAYLAENGFVEVEEKQALYFGTSLFRISDNFRNNEAEFVDTPHYFANGAQRINIFRMLKLSETDQEIYTLYHHFSGGQLNLVEHVSVNFNTDGTINFVQHEGTRMTFILGALID